MTTDTPQVPDEITNSNDYIDSRDVEERIVYLESADSLTSYDQTAQDELNALKKLKEQYIDDYNEDSWSFGAQFIRESYFEEYAQELAEDTGAINRDSVWPNWHIDWEAAAQELQMDYTEVDFDGVTYFTQGA